MQISFVPARADDAAVITALRRRIWEDTYRGIYPDEAIDGYDAAWYQRYDLSNIERADREVFVIRDGDLAIGYLILCCGKAMHLLSLYLLPAYQRRGIGTRVFALVRSRCEMQGLRTFTCYCQPQNAPAVAFYERMGGVVIHSDTGHDNPQEDQITFRFGL